MGEYTEQDLRRVARESTERTLVALGFDVSRPIEIQKDMATLRELRLLFDETQFREDLLYLRQFRISAQSVKSKSLVVAFGLLLTGLGAALWEGIQSLLLHRGS